MNNYAIDTAARFGDIPFVEFTKELVTGVFDSLVEAHILQMEEYSNFVNSLTQDLSTYINNTQDGVDFDQISEFVLNYDLPEIDNSELTTVLSQLESPSDELFGKDPSNPSNPLPATQETWWGGLINGLAPAVTQLVEKVKDPSEIAGLNALNQYNNAVLAGGEIAANNIPTYKQIYDAIAALITSNKYGLLQTIAKQGVMRLVVTEGEIETKLTFSTWNNSSSGINTGNSEKAKVKTKDKRGVFGRIFKGRDKTKTRTITVNTAKSYQNDSSGSKVDIFGRVLIKFKTDYAPLNG
ncbi:hypothetical protein DI487_14620 [Flavobacterium sediminis]|uniref:Uncharacterized protein n=1 Tax=Flavobacterium sediminis TaxID=2201181 RepID=A0A2U8QXK5_9FLAO|nr:hypothetical protein [Flavobacterium sediminis]AWM14962.1 hypothetical protein DI487_14620 [Flavobacterium sediminis]